MSSINEARAIAVLSYHFESAWLSLPRDERNRIRESAADPVFAKYAGTISARFADAEAFSARPTDFILLEFALSEMGSYYYLIEELRDSELIAGGYLTFDSILIGVEDGYQEFEKDNTDD